MLELLEVEENRDDCDPMPELEQLLVAVEREYFALLERLRWIIRRIWYIHRSSSADGALRSLQLAAKLFCALALVLCMDMAK